MKHITVRKRLLISLIVVVCLLLITLKGINTGINIIELRENLFKKTESERTPLLEVSRDREPETSSDKHPLLGMYIAFDYRQRENLETEMRNKDGSNYTRNADRTDRNQQ